MSNLNQCNFIGRVGKDIEPRYMPNGEPVVNLSLAVSESWKDQSGAKQERTEWINATAYKKLAEIIAQYVGKGDLIYISGKMKTRKWQDQSGQDRYTTEIIVDQMQMLGSKSNSGQSAPNSGQSAGNAQRNQPASQQANRGYQAAQNGQNQTPMGEPDYPMDDDIPFAPIGLQYRQLLNCM